MPIERITLNIPDKPLKDLFTWLPRDGGREEFPLLDAATESERIVCTHPSNPSILNTMVAMIENAQDKVFLCNWMLSHTKVEAALARAEESEKEKIKEKEGGLAAALTALTGGGGSKDK